jgi:osmotically-inducible protein OsmY
VHGARSSKDEEMVRGIAMDHTPYRSGQEIFADLKATLDNCQRIPQTVRIHIANGAVTLTGSVRCECDSAEAEDIVRRLDGVRMVVNNITVGVVARAPGAPVAPLRPDPRTQDPPAR